jgi:hypothetical protein
MGNNVMQLYNIRTNEVIAYVISTIKLTTDINSTIPMGKDFNVKINEDGSYNDTDVEIFCMEIVERVYKKHEPGSMSEHEYGHIKEDFFENIPKHYVWYRVVDKVVESRRLKLKKIYDKARIL